ncbi:hypothetical protein [Flavobacterium sp.]
MARREGEKIIGICKLCKEEKNLSFEHYPPSSAYNKNTKYFSVSHEDYFKNSKTESLLNYKPRGKKSQGGLGEFCLCEDCNNFLGTAYVREYKKWASLGMHLLSQGEFKSIGFTVKDINFLKILKQIVAIFICNNDISFTESYKGLIEFVKDVDSNVLPSRYRIFTYLNNEGQIRTGNINFSSLHGAVCEFTFPPFGYVLSIDSHYDFETMLEFTGLKEIKNFDKLEIEMILNKYPTYLPFVPMDHRTKEEIENCSKVEEY